MKLNQMSRDEFKKLLDELSQGSTVLPKLSEYITDGPERSIIIDKDGIFLYLNESNSYFVWDPLDPRTAVASLVTIGTYEILETRILQTLARTSKVIIDIGANVGYYTVLLAKSQPVDGFLHAFEPFPASYDVTTRSVAKNNLADKVTVSQTGLSDNSGKSIIYIPETSGTSAASMKVLHPEETNLEFEIVLETLDSYIQKNNLTNVDLIKIDVEGAELFAIRGGWETIRANRPVVFAELLRKWSAGFGYHPNEVIEMFKQESYQCFEVSEHLHAIESIEEETVPTNFIFVPSEKLQTLDLLKSAVKDLVQN
jgi:FkbM family methyltransferase